MRHSILALPRSAQCRGILGLALCLLIGGVANSTQAQVAIDLHRGPVLTSSRITGIGGAYTSIAEGVDGYFQNPASIANRNARSTQFLDLGLAFDLQRTTNKIDFDNDGQRIGSESNATSLLAGARVALGPFALGAIFTSRDFSATQMLNSETVDSSITVSELAGAAGLSLFEGALIVGGGVGAKWLTLDPGLGDATIADATSIFGDIGVLYRPTHSNLRIGGRLRLPSKANAKRDDDEVIATARYPWEANLGISYMVPFGDRSRNEMIGGWEGWNVERTILDQRYVLFSLDVVADGAVDDAVNPEGWLCTLPDCPRRSGDKMSLGVHAGVESEIVHDRLRLRVGSYSEPDRVAGKLDGRLHFTGGADLRVFTIWILPIKVGVAFDLAPRYANFQLGIGFWT